MAIAPGFAELIAINFVALTDHIAHCAQGMRKSRVLRQGRLLRGPPGGAKPLPVAAGQRAFGKLGRTEKGLVRCERFCG